MVRFIKKPYFSIGMGYSFKDLEDFCTNKDIVFSPTEVDGIRLLVVGDNPNLCKKAIATVKSGLEEMLLDAKSRGDIRDYVVEEIDLSQHPECTNDTSPTWRRMEHNGEEVYIPIFINPEGYPNLAQKIFDYGLSAVIVVSHEGYLAISNPSKKRTYSMLSV